MNSSPESFATRLTARPSLLAAAVLCLIVALYASTHIGCHHDAPVAAIKQAQQEQLRQADRADALLKAAANQLNDLPSAVDTELRPPEVILDSRKSSDHQDVYAICVANPAIPNSPINVIHVPTENGRFKGLNVKSGDLLKYFVREDKTVDEESRRSGLSRQKSIDLKIAQVIDDNTLLIETGLNHAVEFPAKIEIWRNVDDRLHEIHEKLRLYEVYRRPPVGWEPAPDEQVLVQILAWLNQWIRQSDPKTDWQRDPLLDTLDSALLSEKQLAPFLATASLSAEKFQPYDELQPEGERTMRDSLYDGRLLQEAIWLRDISRWAHGDNFDDVSRATALFDWTVRNIQLEPDDEVTAHRPWHVLLYGRGTAEQRAWVFALLCRQQGLNVVMLGIPLAKAAGEKASAAGAMYWLPALVSNGQLYLFDPRLGLPIPGPDGKGVATLDQALKDNSFLRKLDLGGASYPVTAESLKEAKAFIVADPFELTRRATQVEATLSGDDHLTLAVNASELAAQLKGISGISGVGLWELPFRTLRDQRSLGKSARHREALAFEPFAVRPALWKARTRHFQGRRKGAAEPGGEVTDDHQEAVRLYMSKSVRPTVQQIAESQSSDQQRVDSTAKLDATFWLGLLSFDDGKHEVAAHWFGRPDLVAPGSPWLSGARYNLARSLEGQDKFDEAIPLLEQDTSPQQHGNKLRARELKSRPRQTKQDK